MQEGVYNKNNSTNDKIIRAALRKILENDLVKYRAESGHLAQVFEELGVSHGMARIDMAIINGIMHGYEIKSDLDTLQRLPEQMKEYNTIFDKITLVVGRRHLHEAINLIPDWWGIVIAKIDNHNNVVFYDIREAEDNPQQNSVSIARLLWREEALKILEEQNKATGFYSKPRSLIYERLAEVTEINILKERVRNTLLLPRVGWRSGRRLMINDG